MNDTTLAQQDQNTFGKGSQKTWAL